MLDKLLQFGYVPKTQLSNLCSEPQWCPPRTRAIISTPTGLLRHSNLSRLWRPMSKGSRPRRPRNSPRSSCDHHLRLATQRGSTCPYKSGRTDGIEEAPTEIKPHIFFNCAPKEGGGQLQSNSESQDSQCDHISSCEANIIAKSISFTSVGRMIRLWKTVWAKRRSLGVP